MRIPIASLLVAAFSAASFANSLVRRSDLDSCPSGYSMSVSYITVTAAPSQTVASSTITSTTTITVTVSLESNTAATSTFPGNSAPETVPPTKTSATNYSTPTTEITNTATGTLTASGPQLTPSKHPEINIGNTGKPLTGQATFYQGNIAGGACSFSSYTLPSGILGTALSSSNWDNAANCGACIIVAGPGGNSIKAMVVDECPGCGQNHLDLFQNAFGELAEIATGVINVNWSIVECGISSPIILRNKDDGAIPKYWFSMQIINANIPVASLEISTDNGATWQATTRTSYNYFERSPGFGADTVDARVTSVTGSTIIVNKVGCAAGSSTTASANFAS